MAQLMLRGQPLGTIQGVLFDKDGTLSNSEQYLINLAIWRIKEVKNFFEEKYKNKSESKTLEEYLSVLYGLSDKGLNPNGILAIA